jgi:hypothetical protein
MSTGSNSLFILANDVLPENVLLGLKAGYINEMI